ncbi:hypothetical protein K2X85_05950 [bacterium]|nr:hypothetical protein [bacterium]
MLCQPSARQESRQSLFRQAVRAFVTASLIVGIGAPSAHAAVELVQLTAANIELYVTGPARKLVVPGDVILRNDMISVAVLTGSSKNDTTRSGRCVVLSESSQVSSHPLSQVSPGPSVPWTRPEAGSNANLAVLRFYRTESTWSAELTYRLREGVPWVEVSTHVVNKSPDRVLEIPVVDQVETLSDGKGETSPEGILTLVTSDRPTVGYVPVGNNVLSEQARDTWYLGIASGDPLDGAWRRASMRIMSMGRQSTSYMPLESGREWGRSLRDRESWHRIEAKKERSITRRILLATTPNQLASLLPIARESAPSGGKPPAPAEKITTKEPEIVMSNDVQRPASTLASPAAKVKGPISNAAGTKTTIAGKRRPTSPATPASIKITAAETETGASKITGKLRGNANSSAAATVGDIELPATMLPDQEAPVPSLPTKSKERSVTKPAPVKAEKLLDEADFAPTIDAIEELPPPIE